MRNIKFIINQSGVKRQIEGPFEILANAADFMTLLECIGENIGVRVERPDVFRRGYGWVKIFAAPDMEVKPNTQPLKWTDATNINPPYAPQ